MTALPLTVRELTIDVQGTPVSARNRRTTLGQWTDIDGSGQRANANRTLTRSLDHARRG